MLINIKTRDNGAVSIRAAGISESGVLAVHRRHMIEGWRRGCGYDITHIGTGYKITRTIILTLSRARELMAELDALDWNDISGRDCSKVQMLAPLVRDILSPDERANGWTINSAPSAPRLSRQERAAEIERRRDSVLAECNKNLPFYNPQ